MRENAIKIILVIEDQAQLRENASDFLQLKGFEVHGAKDGAEGIQKAISVIPDLIICDIMMPNINGYEVFRTIKQVPATANIPFIFLTAKTQLVDFREGMLMGADDYITKPFKLNDLLASVNLRLEKYQKVIDAANKKFNALLEDPFVGVFVYSNNAFSFANNKFLRIFEITENELSNFDWLQRIEAKDRNEFTEKVNEVFSGIVKKQRLNFKFIDRAGAALYLELFLKQITEKRKVNIIGTVRSKNAVKSSTTEHLEHDSNALEQIFRHLAQNENIDSQTLIRLSKSFNFSIKKESDSQEKLKDLHISKRELEVLSLICNGFTNDEIANKLFISSRTVGGHRNNLLAKTQTKNTASLVAFAIKNKLVNYND